MVLAVFAVLHPFSPVDARDTDETQLKKLRARIESLQENLNETRGRRDSVREEVRGLERRIGGLVNRLRDTEDRLQAAEKQLAGLGRRAANEHSQLESQRRHLGRQIRTAYLMGRQEYTKMLLSQENPARISRVLTYYRYLNRARAERIGRIQAGLSQLKTLEQEIRERRRELETLRDDQREQKSALESSRARRGQLLASLNREVRSRSHEIERLRSDEKRLERLVEELKTALPDPPWPPPGTAAASFVKLRGRLPLPVRGPVLARYGGSKNVGNLKWRGLLIGGREGQDVRSVFRGRVVFADWLRGFGLLLILDHGDGYMTLYGHNQSLRKNVGDWVEAGDTIASLGNTGDMPESGLYFEIRHNGEPHDPLVWCRAR